ncbi:alpha-L-rhamnosidase [Parabacteroides sp. PFB2-12]|uniref:glycoside hydrolase family 78 protein n=1 Tax=Parabacteroides sp. PFB2-12 TaxID=2940652 RepID=UPI002473794B|nr:glycoside hydrolase family 78 protein [Parabacteroides sp. PFB2-12]MDH6343503.1 alpha-L-rhamnosidase [Parabacteroides sp. PM6-13]MDH6390897.1 alpha-L-rhamnosidase [Parabacteroides sp. PFB2-12]
MNHKFTKRVMPILLLLLISIYLQANPSIVKLQTEFMDHPIGMDVSRPRFSWKMQSDRYGAAQTAYRIVVALSQDDLAKGNYVYDTNKIDSDASIGIAYNGDALKATTRYFWKVQVWDEKNQMSESATEWFETGLLGTSWRNAQWIGSSVYNLSKYRSQFVIDYDFQIAQGSHQAVFLFGVKNPKSYISIKIDTKEKAKLILSRTLNGVETIEYSEDVSSIITASNKLAKHHIKVDVAGPRGYSMYIELNGNKIKATSKAAAAGGPGGPQGMYGGNDPYRFRTNNDSPEEPNANSRLYQIGFNQPKGEKATFSDIQISENYWNSIQYADQKEYAITGDGKVLSWQPGGDISAPMLRKTIQVSKKLKQARLYATARGVYEFYINDKKVGKDYLNPGWTDYRYRIMYNTFDITDILKEGANGVGAMIGTGWFSDHMGFNSSWQDQYGVKQSLMAMITLEYTDGTKETIVTDGSWKCYDNGPIEANSLLNGEDYNAMKEVPGWTLGHFDDSKWQEATVVEAPSQTVILQGYVGLTAQNTVTLKAKSVKKVGNTYVYDLGQNMAGVPRLVNMKGKAGQQITIHFAEMLYPEVIPTNPVAPYTVEMYKEKKGQMYLENYRSALSTDHYTFKGDPKGETYEPRFTYHGFRYLSIDGLDEPLPLENVLGIALESIGEQTSYYATSNENVNRLFENIVWGQRGNFLAVPTDCPQRDERMGWTGDAQVFARAATYNMNVDPFFTRWFHTVRDNQGTDGGYAGYFPNLGPPPAGAPATGGMVVGGWQEVGVIVPWQLYQQYGDVGMIEEHYPSMVKFIDYLERIATDYIQPIGGTGDWLGLVSTNTMLTNTAYAGYAAWIMKNIAEALNKESDAKRFATFYDNIKKAFNKTFVDAEGYTIVPAEAARFRGMPTPGSSGQEPEVIGDDPVRVHTQTSYILPLYFGLFDDQNKEKAIQHLLETIKDSDYTLTTGFVGTPYITTVLSENGYHKEAYNLFLQTKFASWLFPVMQGATTMWERWNSYTVENGFGPVSMNSFNHYAYGAIEEWMMSHSAGIERDLKNPGYKHIILQPQTDERLDYVKAGFETMYGMVESSWEVKNGKCTYKVTVPPNTTATLYLPAKNAGKVNVAKGKEGIRSNKYNNGKSQYELTSGSYEFVVSK